MHESHGKFVQRLALLEQFLQTLIVKRVFSATEIVENELFETLWSKVLAGKEGE